MLDELIPNEEEVRIWLLSTLRHSCHLEYFLDKLNLGKDDPERPHDIVGLGNKYDWLTIRGFALQYRVPKVDFNHYILPSLNFHRQQYHHRKWNNSDENDLTKPFSGASRDDMLVGALDTICSLLEDRQYQGGIHKYDQIIEIIRQNPPHKIPWLLDILPKMRLLNQPNINAITRLDNFPNIGLSKGTYLLIVEKTHEAVELLRERYGYFGN